MEIFYRALFHVPGTAGGFVDNLAPILNGEVQVDPSDIKTTLSDEVGPVQNNYYRAQGFKTLTGIELLCYPKCLLPRPTELLSNSQDPIR